MKPIIEKAKIMQKKAWDIIKDTNVNEIWSSIGGTINLVGSKTPFLLRKR